ncbi:MAG: hypothetical protein JWM41_1777 [Gemmatimonadetes bacterium]|nr:hypothetical protein [Gemmatimonadota bacterium]
MRSKVVDYIDGTHGMVDPFGDLDAEDDDLDDAEDADDLEPVSGPLRKPEPKYSPNPQAWLDSALMTRTEAALRLARHLLTAHLAASDVRVSLTGFELTHRERPKFPVQRFLAERACLPEAPETPDAPNGSVADAANHCLPTDWRTRYIMKHVPHALVLDSQPGIGDVEAMLADGRRLVAHVSRGRLSATRSPGEHKLLRAALGRALTFERYAPLDVGAAVIPRSPRFRELAARWRHSPIVVRAGLLILTVDRVGNVEGIEFGQ